MSGYRLGTGGLIDRGQHLHFSFDGKRFSGYGGDTLASALLASGVTLFGRSFKYHRPRGVFSAGLEEPNALVTLREGARREPNTKATETELFDGLSAESQHRWPSLAFDLMAVNGLFAPLIGAGFYYKTFMGPGHKAWLFYEHFIRKAAGLGSGTYAPDPDRYEKMNAFCDVLVVGGGPTGLAAALTAAEAGLRVILAEHEPTFGGALIGERRSYAGTSAHERVQIAVGELAAMKNVTLLPRTTVYGYFDGNTLGAVERVCDHLPVPPAHLPRQRNWMIRARRVILATGAIERPLVFAGNDLPGVMLAEAAKRYVTRYAVSPGRRVALFANNDGAYRTLEALAEAKVEIAAVIDLRREIGAEARAIAQAANVEVLTGQAVIRASGGQCLRSIAVAPLGGGTKAREIEADCLAISGGWTPSIHLASQAGGRPRFDEQLVAFLAGEPREAWEIAGAANGLLDTVSCLEAGAKAAVNATETLGARATAHDQDRADRPEPASAPLAVWEIPATRGGKRFVDFQMDVTVEDVLLARREGFKSVEHLKRYTTLGMAADQGKTSNMSGLAIMAAAEGLSIPEVGTTRFRPPFNPVALGNFPARAVGSHFKPHRLTPMHDWHVKAGAEMMTAGLWQRPRIYPRPGETVEQAYVREAATVREKVGIVDVSTLGKIDVQGPDAAEFLDRVYCNAWLKLPVGKARYGFMLREDGVVMDDGTTWRLGENRFLMTTTTAHAGLVMSHLEHLLSAVWPELRVQVASVTDCWAGAAVAGPLARDVLKSAIKDIDFASENFPVMGVRHGTLDGIPVLVARLSFSGELAYEVFCGAHHGMAVWEKLIAAGAPYGLVPYGMEALGTLRIEKGHVTGNELDGRTTLDDVGFGAMAKKDRDYIGRRLKDREGLRDPKRHRMVGLISLEGKLIHAGAQLVEQSEPGTARSLGHVTSTAFSPALDKYVALALLEGGLERQGQKIYAASPTRGQHVAAEVTAPCFFDPDGSRMRV